MGNAIRNRHSSDAPGKVILPDGTIHYYDKPLTVAELMLEYPQQVVVEFQQTMIVKKPVPLPADKNLEMNKVYLMLPIRRGKPAALSSQEARIVLLKANSILKSKSLLVSSSTGFLPLIARMCAAGTSRERHDDEFYSLTGRKKKPAHHYTNNYRQEEEEEEEEVITCKPPDYLNDVLLMEERPEYLSRQISGKAGWKPSLDTITEKAVQTKVRHWLF
ncbi:hypothetical protein ACH5RR_019973 [Cinchona calisaya]|uniref:Uncharacterized protein n=1 Tax=Cinchona calisaya TaxID=153742 RepID=A0ABD2ZE67_9GENT